MSRRGPGAAVALVAAITLLLTGRSGAWTQDEEPTAVAAAGEPEDAEPTKRGYNDLRRIIPISGDAARGQAKTELCSACHGPDGIAVVPMYPNIAGQRADYLYWQLVKFRDAGEGASVMAAAVAGLSDQDMRDLSAYYAGLDPAGTPAAADGDADVSEAPAEEPPDPAMLALGEQLYLSGDPAKGIPPCQACHGGDARGHPRPLERDSADYTPHAVYPLLRGQHGPYLQARLGEYREGKHRSSTTDFIMGDVGHRLDDDSIQALSAWLSSLSN